MTPQGVVHVSSRLQAVKALTLASLAPKSCLWSVQGSTTVVGIINQVRERERDMSCNHEGTKNSTFESGSGNGSESESERKNIIYIAKHWERKNIYIAKLWEEKHHRMLALHRHYPSAH